jgi:hypothetical protein
MSKSEESKELMIPVIRHELLSKWDIGVVDLNRNDGMFAASNVRVRNCSLNYSDACREYYVEYKSVTYGLHDIFNLRITHT